MFMTVAFFQLFLKCALQVSNEFITRDRPGKGIKGAVAVGCNVHIVESNMSQKRRQLFGCTSE